LTEALQSDGDEVGFKARAGALTLSCVANPTERQPALPAEEAHFVASVLERWLSAGPSGPPALGPDRGPALSALLGGWSSTVIHALAARPLTVAEATEAVGGLSHDAVGEQIAAMESVGLLAVLPAETGGEQRFAVTDWLRIGIAPLAAAARMEIRHPPGDTEPIAPLDVEAAFQLALPLVSLSEELSASCRLTVPVPGRPPRLAGAAVLVEQGKVTSVSPGLEMQSDTFATGAPIDWLDTLIDPSAAKLDTSGDLQICLGLLDGLHEKLFGAQGAA
jgi:hypothetical protein